MVSKRHSPVLLAHKRTKTVKQRLFRLLERLPKPYLRREPEKLLALRHEQYRRILPSILCLVYLTRQTLVHTSLNKWRPKTFPIWMAW